MYAIRSYYVLKSFPDGLSYKPLPGIYKCRYPFRLSVPSFLYPDTWAANARMLAPHVDEIELLFFESKPKVCLPSREEIRALRNNFV